MAAILNSTILNLSILNLSILNSAILVFPLKLTHTCQDWFPPFAQKKNLHSFILTQLDDGSHLEFCHLGFSHLSFLVFPLKLTHACQNWFPPFAQKNFTHSFWLNLMMTAILNLAWWIQTLPSWIQTPCYLLSDSLKNTLPPLWLKLIQSDSNSFILTQLDDGSHLEFGYLGFCHLTHTCQDWFPPFAQKNLHSFILTQLDDGSHLECYHLGFRHLVIFCQIHSKTLSLHSDSDSY